jgi:aspartyl-tRNA synthetase
MIDENRLTTHYRTHTCGQLDGGDEGKGVSLAGWVNRRRDHGGLIFLDLRDRYGKTQAVFHPGVLGPARMEEAKKLRMEDVVAVRGVVRMRPGDMRNPDMPTGDIEVRVEEFTPLSRAETTPFVVSTPGEVQEDLRFTYRYLDLRRPELQRNLLVRHDVIQAAHRSLNRMGFAEIETPILTKRTPEGARDYLVPSRVHPGKFYALPQSPQLYKQLLMVAGMDRYYQIARCFRDEDLRADRQPEFTQIDIEMSFAAEEDVIGVSEELVADVFRECLDVELDLPLPRMTFREAMEGYGIDRPDLRFDLRIRDLSPFFRDTGFGVFRQSIEEGGRVRGIGVPGGRSFSRKDKDSCGCGGEPTSGKACR